MKLSQLEKLLRQAWSEKTSSNPQNWTSKNPALGQCVVSSLIVQDYFGGSLVWSNVELPNGEFVSHYFNKINGNYIDVTKDQFLFGFKIPEGVEKKKEFASTRDYVLSYPATQKRYEILLENLNALR